MSIGMECSLYTPGICDGHYCPRDEEHCEYGEKILENEDSNRDVGYSANKTKRC